MVKRDVWDCMFWIGMAIVVGYVFAKIVGLINGPEWFQYILIIGIVFMVGVFYQKMIQFSNVMYQRTDYFKGRIEKIDDKLNDHEKRIWKLGGKNG
jgi:hypothetical protein